MRHKISKMTEASLMKCIPLALMLGVATSTLAADIGDMDTAITRIAFGSCADETLPQPIWDSIAADNPDLFLFIGDNVYADHYKGEWLEEPAIEAVEHAYMLMEASPDFAAFRQQTPMMGIWDDHDYGLNDAGVELPIKAQSKDLMLDFFHVPDSAPVRQRDGAYQAAIFGPKDKRVQIILLDTRWFRSPLQPTDKRDAKGKERYLPDDDPEKTMLGAEQWAWLEEQLEKPAELRLIISSIQVIADSHGWESWRTLTHERDRLFRLLNKSGADNVILLSGDRHLGGLYRRDDVTDYPLYEITSSSLNRSFAGDTRITEYGPYQIGHLYGPENFGLIDIDWQEKTLSLSLKNMAGKTVRGLTVSLDDLRDWPN